MTHKEEHLVKNIQINNINKTLKNYILEHEKKFIRSKFDYRIDSLIEKFNKNNRVNLYITFYSKKKDVTHNYHLKCPKPMIENQLFKILNANPLLIKSIGPYLKPNPLLDRIIYKNWGHIDIINNKKKLVLDYNWYEFGPQHPSQEILEFMRSCWIS